MELDVLQGPFQPNHPMILWSYDISLLLEEMFFVYNHMFQLQTCELEQLVFCDPDFKNPALSIQKVSSMSWRERLSSFSLGHNQCPAPVPWEHKIFFCSYFPEEGCDLQFYSGWDVVEHVGGDNTFVSMHFFPKSGKP